MCISWLYLYFPPLHIYRTHKTPRSTYTHGFCLIQEMGRALERRGKCVYLFIYLWPGSVSWQMAASCRMGDRSTWVTPRVSCQAGRHSLCALHLKWWCCSLLKHHLLNNFGIDHLSYLPAFGRDHLLWFWREEWKLRGSWNLMLLQSTCSITLKSFRSSERILSKRASPTHSK